jgi:hypothetical protein
LLDVHVGDHHLGVLDHLLPGLHQRLARGGLGLSVALEVVERPLDDVPHRRGGDGLEVQADLEYLLQGVHVGQGAVEGVL